MSRFVKSVFCLFLCALTVLLSVGCSDKGESSATEQTTSEQTTAPSSAATADTAEQTKSLDYNKIKQDSDSIKAQFDAIISKSKFRGVVYAKLGNDFEYIGANGFSDKDKRSNNSVNTTYYAGSVTTQITAAAVLLLQQDGKVSVNDKLSKYYPDYKYGEDITIENLLTMTAGLADCFNKGESNDKSACYRQNELPYKISKNAKANENQNTIVKWILNQDLLYEPGEKFLYSNSAYYLLGDIIEKVSGKSYEKYVEENIFKPLSMTSSSFKAGANTAKGYQDIYDNEWCLYSGVGYSASGLVTNVSDMLKWLDALSDNKLLSEESKKAMTTPYMSDYGYGVYVDESGNIHSSGFYYRFNSYMYASKDMKNVYIIFSNYSQSSPKNIYDNFNSSIKKYYK